MSQPIPLGQPTTGTEEVEAIRRVLESGWIAGQGPATKSFEAAFARRMGAPDASAVSNCTAGLHLALLALGVGRGDEIIVADYTYPATAHAVLFSVRAPVRRRRPGDRAGRRRCSRGPGQQPHGRIVAVDAVGQCADYAELRALAQRRGLFLVEDAACSAGGRHHGIPSGQPRSRRCRGVQPPWPEGHHLRRGWRGHDRRPDDLAVRREAAVLRRRVRTVAGATSDDLRVPVFDALGWNYKLSDLSARSRRGPARPDRRLVARRQTSRGAYVGLLGDATTRVARCRRGPEHTWQSYVVTLDRRVARVDVVRALRRDGIGCNIGTFACHLQPVYGYVGLCPVSADVFARHLAIPMHANLTDGDVERVAASVLDAVRSRSVRLSHVGA